MPKDYTMGDDILVQKKNSSSTVTEKELAEELLQAEGYTPPTKPRRVNGGEEIASASHTDKNKKRLNQTLSKTPEPARQSVKRKSVAQRIMPFRAEREKAASPFPISYMFFILILTAIMVYVVHLYIEISELDATISECNNTLVELKSEQNDLQFEKNRLIDLEEIERIAREEYGMVSADQLPKEYITSEGGDRIQILETEDDKSAAGVLMSGFGKVIGSALSYIN